VHGEVEAGKEESCQEEEVAEYGGSSRSTRYQFWYS
jgi:hypothetical protein